MADGRFQIGDVVTENISCISQTDLIQLFFKDELEFENLQALTKTNKKDYGGADFTQIPLDLKQEALKREQYTLAVLEKNDNRRTKEFLCPLIEEISQRINDSHPPSYITLYRWLKDTERSPLLAKAQRNSGKSVAEICKAVGFSPSYWYLIINGQEEAIAEDTLRKIEKFLDFKFHDDRLSVSQLDLARAIEQAVNAGAHIINISGGQLTDEGETEG